MGGNLFKKSIRISKKEYSRIVEYFLNNTINFFGILDTSIEAPWKEDYGDVDFLYHQGGSVDWEKLRNIAPYTEISVNGPTTSILFEGKYHLDFKKTKSMEYLKWLDSYGGIHNIIGSSLKKQSMKLSTTGIYYQNDTIKIHLTYDFTTILKFLDLDYQKFKKGFNTRGELYDYILSCPLVSISSANKKMKRNFKRPIFVDFFDYIDRLKITFNPTMYNPIEIMTFFGKLKEYNMILEEIRINKKIKKYFNGRYISEFTGKSGLILGVFMKKLRKHPDHRKIFISHDVNKINTHISLSLK